MPGLPKTWFAQDESRPLMFFAGIWREWEGTRGTKANPVEGKHLLFSFDNLNCSVPTLSPRLGPRTDFRHGLSIRQGAEFGLHPPIDRAATKCDEPALAGVLKAGEVGPINPSVRTAQSDTSLERRAMDGTVDAIHVLGGADHETPAAFDLAGQDANLDAKVGGLCRGGAQYHCRSGEQQRETRHGSSLYCVYMLNDAASSFFRQGARLSPKSKSPAGCPTGLYRVRNVAGGYCALPLPDALPLALALTEALLIVLLAVPTALLPAVSARPAALFATPAPRP